MTIDKVSKVKEKKDCHYFYSCCSCGGNECGCRYCFDCNACEACLSDDETEECLLLESL